MTAPGVYKPPTPCLHFLQAGTHFPHITTTNITLALIAKFILANFYYYSNMVQIKLSVAFVLAAVAIGPVAALPAAVTQPTTVSQLGAVPTSVSSQRPTVAQPPVAQPGAGVASGGT